MNYDQMTISEMEEIYTKLGKEIEKRKDAVMRGDWEKLVEQIQFFIERHGGFSVINELGGEDCIDCEADFDDPGIIYLRWE